MMAKAIQKQCKTKLAEARKVWEEDEQPIDTIVVECDDFPEKKNRKEIKVFVDLTSMEKVST